MRITQRGPDDVDCVSGDNGEVEMRADSIIVISCCHKRQLSDYRESLPAVWSLGKRKSLSIFDSLILVGLWDDQLSPPRVRIEFSDQVLSLFRNLKTWIVVARLSLMAKSFLSTSVRAVSNIPSQSSYEQGPVFQRCCQGTSLF
jgi:hypothetical protein